MPLCVLIPVFALITGFLSDYTPFVVACQEPFVHISWGRIKSECSVSIPLWSGNSLRRISSHLLFPELLTIRTSPFPIVCAAVINWVGLYQRNYFSPQPELSLFNRY